jgi:hypothetical protein
MPESHCAVERYFLNLRFLYQMGVAVRVFLLIYIPVRVFEHGLYNMFSI